MRRIKQIEVQAGQSIWNIALQEYGNPEAAVLVLQANPGIAITDVLTPGQLLTIWSDAVINTITEVVSTPALYGQLQQILADWSIVISQIRDRYLTAVAATAQSTGTLPTVTNANGVLQLAFTRNNGLPELTLNLGSIAAKKFWLGTLEDYEAIETPDENTIYHIEEAEA